LGKPKDLSQPTGDVKRAVIYSNTVAMSPMQKESAYKHLPIYTMGIIFHIGSFLALLLFVFFFFSRFYDFLFANQWITCFLSTFLCISCLSGISLFIKRLKSPKLQPFSNFDDYLSNALVSLFQLGTIAMLVMICNLHVYLWIEASYYVTCTLLFLYLPFGKLKHVCYYFAARYHLGFFYGWRNTWPPKHI